MNIIEKWVYEAVKNNPKLKFRIVGFYQLLCSCLPHSSLRSVSPITVRPRSFFGFHDKCPWSPDNRRLLTHRFTIPERPLLPQDEVEIGFYEEEGYTQFVSVGRTQAWNWQQGASLQWLGEGGNIVYSAWNGTDHVARVVDPFGKVRDFGHAVSTVNPKGTHGAGFQFRRFQDGFPGYGYLQGEDPEFGVSVPSKPGSGLVIVDFTTGAVRELFTVTDLVQVDPHPSMAGAMHFLSHALFSPSGTRIGFMHRWRVQGNRLWTRMFTCNLDGSGLHMLPTIEMVSHIAWKGPNHLLAYARTHDGDGYYLFQDQSQVYQPIGLGHYNSDGHPQVSPNGRFMLTDTYPDRFRLQFLSLFDLQNPHRVNIARIHSPRRYRNVLAVDLHPRWNRDGTCVCFDSSHTGVRSLCTMPVNLDDVRSI